MRVYLGSPGNIPQAVCAEGMDVLISFAARNKEIERNWLKSFNGVLLDSGAYSEFNSGVAIDPIEYVDWANSIGWADAFAGLDDISGDWRRSMENYKYGGFPTFHDTDPYELLDELIPLARERGKWIGIGLLPPRNNKDNWMRETLSRLPMDLHVHGFALGAYTHHARINSIDSTHWWRESWKVLNAYPWLTPHEAIEVIVKKIKRRGRALKETSDQGVLF